MFSLQRRKFALTTLDWELQRQTYIEHAKSLNAEFEHYKKLGGTVHPVAVHYTLAAPTVGTRSGESVIRLPRGYHRLRVFSGCAWVTYNASDYVLGCGDEMVFDRDSSDAVVSSVGRSSLNFQIIP